ncbi:PKD domain-containing protein, partial [Algoriphagus alkaliphilus]
MDKPFNCQTNILPPQSGFFEGNSNNALFKLLLVFLLILGGSFLFPSSGYSQGQIVGTVPIVINPANPPGCPQNNVTISEIQFRDEGGIPFPSPFNPNNLEIGDEIPGEIWVKFGGSTSNAYNLYAQFDVFINGVKDGSTRTLCLFGGVKVPTQDGLFYYIDDFTWEYGDKLEIKNIYMTWTTGNAGTGNCTPRLQNSQCYYNPTGLVVNTPLVSNFSFQTFCQNRNVAFTNLTTGGDPAVSATYLWSFGNGNTSTQMNPTHTYASAGTYTVTLTSTKSGVVKSFSKEVIVNDQLSLTISNTEDDDCSINSTGSIDITVLGGDGDYTFLWSTLDGNGLVVEAEDQTGLSAGTYTVLVTDARECTATTSVIIIQPQQSPTPNPQTFDFCEGSGDQPLLVTPTGDYTITWYDSEMNPLQGAPTVSTSSAGNESFYITQFKEGECESEMAEVTVTINPAPAAPTSPVNVTICEGDAESITANATVPQGFSIVWYTTADGDVTTESPSLSTVGTITYYAASVNNETECESLTRTPVTLTILAAPAAPTSPVNVTICE